MDNLKDEFEETIVTKDGCIIDLKKLEVTCNNITSALTNAETLIVLRLVAAKGYFVANYKILDTLWGVGDFDGAGNPESTVVKEHICKLRKKMGKEAIITKIHTGYRLNI